MQLGPINTNVVRSNPTQVSTRGVLPTTYYMMKFVCDLWHVGGFLRVLQFPPPIKCQ